jgi:ribosomal protein S18 acetylase RimI-like enzyme
MVLLQHHLSLLRPVDPSRDLDEIANLIELCFEATMDDDGKEYVRYLRRIANNRLYHFVYENSTQRPISVEGFIWEEEKKIVGNLTLIPFQNEKNPHYLIANVAVHPNYRQKGIAHRLTYAALQEIQKRQPGSVWLHVRDDNKEAIHLYESFGFVERTHRSVWEMNPYSRGVKIPWEYQIHPRQRPEWIQQKEWLQISYPENIRWNFQFDEKRFIPGVWEHVKYWFSNNPIVHYSLNHSQILKGIVTFENTSRRSNVLWLACLPVNDAEVINFLIPASMRHFPHNRPLSINYPEERGISAFLKTGWKKINTLIWMEHEK